MAAPRFNCQLLSDC